jgi:ankyrin repeat protein
VASTCQGVVDFLKRQTQVEAASQALRVAELSTYHQHSILCRMTGLHLAAYFGIKNAVRVLLDTQEPNVEDSHGWTPLYWAAWNGHTAVVTALLGAGAALDKIDEVGRTPLHNAAQNGHTAVVTALLAAGAAVDVKDPVGWTPLLVAARNGHTAIVTALLAAGAAVDLKVPLVRIPLHLADKNAHTVMVTALHEAGTKGHTAATAYCLA